MIQQVFLTLLKMRALFPLACIGLIGICLATVEARILLHSFGCAFFMLEIIVYGLLFVDFVKP